MFAFRTLIIASLIALPLAAQHEEATHEEATQEKRANRLATEKSPYLQQHKYNPVDWWPWGDAAFEEAEKRGLPVFVSIGYSTCHWCHVMEHESFSDPEIAKLMNASFINVKVDREELPDVDSVCQKYIQSMTRDTGGWPASVWLTPDRKPFYAGTYFPPAPKFGRPGFKDLVDGLNQSWKEKRTEIEEYGVEVMNIVSGLADGEAAEELPASELVDVAAAFFLQGYDKINGGFGQAPKFPRTSTYELLLYASQRSGDPDYSKAALHSLRRMAEGGVYDQVGGGFHRYSTDAIWLVPHFEKMLYDQALCAATYVEAWQFSGDDFYAEVVRDILDCVLRDFLDAKGGFYSAYDADSGGSEGTYYIWGKDELKTILDAETFKVFDARFDLSEHGNWEEGARRTSSPSPRPGLKSRR